jgi:hypothetical protein
MVFANTDFLFTTQLQLTQELSSSGNSSASDGTCDDVAVGAGTSLTPQREESPCGTTGNGSIDLMGDKKLQKFTACIWNTDADSSSLEFEKAAPISSTRLAEKGSPSSIQSSQWSSLN